eukprot:COSAG06_NODE_26561_length_612_cov_0.873294_1_plen_27_part_01
MFTGDALQKKCVCVCVCVYRARGGEWV